MKKDFIPVILIVFVAITTLVIYGIMFRTESAVKNERNEASSQDSQYSGVVIVDAASPFIEFKKKDYDDALKSNKIIILDFYADWCPICRGEAPLLEKGFRDLNNPDVIGFRVNFKDTQTDEDEEELAKQFAITYQYTKVILKDGKEVLKDGEVWDTETFLSTVRSVIQ